MKSFDLYLPKTVDEALELLGREHGAGGVALLAGGQDLLTEMKEHLREPSSVVSLAGLPGMGQVELQGDGALSLGALVTIARIEHDDALARRYPILVEAAASVASPQIRSQGTLGGNLCQRPRCWYYRNESLKCLKRGGNECFSYGGLNKYNAILGGGPSYIVHPSDMAPALVALRAEVLVVGPSAGKGTLPMRLEKFYTLPAEGDVTRENVLAPGDLLTAVRVPAHAGDWRSTYIKFKERGSFDFALSAVALALRMDGAKIAEARLVLGGVAPIPWRCADAERLLAGRTIDEKTCREVAEAALEGAEPLSGNAYKVPLTKGLIVRALRKLGSPS